MRRLADAPLRRRQAERRAHRPIEKGVGLDRGRPDRLVEACQKHAIEAQETRFEEAQDHKARVSAARRRSARRGQRIVEQSRVFVERSREVPDRRLAPFVHELRQWLEPVGVRRQALRSGDRGGDRSPMLNEAIAQGSGGPEGAQGGERPRDIARQRLRRKSFGLAYAANREMRVPVVSRRSRRHERLFQIIERRKRHSAKDGKL